MAGREREDGIRDVRLAVLAERTERAMKYDSAIPQRQPTVSEGVGSQPNADTMVDSCCPATGASCASAFLRRAQLRFLHRRGGKNPSAIRGSSFAASLAREREREISVTLANVTFQLALVAEIRGTARPTKCSDKKIAMTNDNKRGAVLPGRAWQGKRGR